MIQSIKCVSVEKVKFIEIYRNFFLKFWKFRKKTYFFLKNFIKKIIDFHYVFIKPIPTDLQKSKKSEKNTEKNGGFFGVFSGIFGHFFMKFFF